jgi:hypothetical protein
MDFGSSTLSSLPSSKLVKPFNLLGGDITAGTTNTSPLSSDLHHYATGTARVPGKGAPTKDTVKAKLAPGEAVLNAAAAEMMGRHNIASLNAHGAMAMGMPRRRVRATSTRLERRASRRSTPSMLKSPRWCRWVRRSRRRAGWA